MGRLTCPSDETISAFAEGRLDAGAIARVEAHAVTCALCQDLLVAALGAGTLGPAASVRAQSGSHAFHEPGATDEGGIRRGVAIDRYTILSLIGRGGMGEVYGAYDPRVDRRVAVKLAHARSGPETARAKARFMLEAQALAKVSHRNVVTVHEAGTFEGRVFIVMEFVDGVTLKDWLAERPRTRPEILAVFADAARGLATVHMAGLAHRDFKPTNVMIAKDGTVHVTDFGLALDVTRDMAPDADASATPPGLHLTRTGELLGTPLYMAPEQFLGGNIDARSDQFSFCVALYQALYGALPFGHDALDVLRANVLAGRVAPAPSKNNVPVWLRRVLLRGLSVAPDARWASMSDLIAALGRDPARTRRRWGLAAIVLSVVGLCVFTIGRNALRPAQLCLGGPARLAGAWESAAPARALHPRRDAIERAFLASGAPGARDVWERVASLLDRYRAGWLGMYRDACEATNLRGDQPAAILDLRMTCLDERRLALSALTDVLVTADREVVGSAVDAANALPPLAACADRHQLESTVEAPRDETTRKRVDELRGRAAIAKALNDTGKRDEARTLARAELQEARALGYLPLVAEMLVALARTYTSATFQTEFVQLEEEALWTSLAVGRDDLAAEAASALVAGYGGFLAQFAEGRVWAKLASAALDRAGAGHELVRSWLLTDEANMAMEEHDPRSALPLIQDALALKEKILPPDHPDIALSIGNEANTLALLNRTEEALRLNTRAYDIMVRAYGPASMEVAYALSNRGEYLITLGRPGEALEPLRRGRAVWEVQSGPQNPLLGYPLTALGRALLALARPSDALPPLERALRLREPGEEDPLLVAETRFALARALWDADRDHTRAVMLAKKACAAFAKASVEKDAAEIGTWLATRSADDSKP